MAKYNLTANAQESMRGIKAYSLEHFGKRQTEIYLEKIYDCIRFAAENPNHGKDRGALIEGLFSKLAGSHIIYYTIESTHIEIVDVLHQSMEPTLHLGDEE